VVGSVQDASFCRYLNITGVFATFSIFSGETLVFLTGLFEIGVKSFPKQYMFVSMETKQKTKDLNFMTNNLKMIK
jgi:hypothetical protein